MREQAIVNMTAHSLRSSTSKSTCTSNATFTAVALANNKAHFTNSANAAEEDDDEQKTLVRYSLTFSTAITCRNSKASLLS